MPLVVSWSEQQHVNNDEHVKDEHARSWPLWIDTTARTSPYSLRLQAWVGATGWHVTLRRQVSYKALWSTFKVLSCAQAKMYAQDCVARELHPVAQRVPTRRQRGLGTRGSTPCIVRGGYRSRPSWKQTRRQAWRSSPWEHSFADVIGSRPQSTKYIWDAVASKFTAPPESRRAVNKEMFSVHRWLKEVHVGRSVSGLRRQRSNTASSFIRGWAKLSFDFVPLSLSEVGNKFTAAGRDRDRRTQGWKDKGWYHTSTQLARPTRGRSVRNEQTLQESTTWESLKKRRNARRVEVAAARGGWEGIPQPVGQCITLLAKWRWLGPRDRAAKEQSSDWPQV